MTTIDKVREFHQAFNQPWGREPGMPAMSREETELLESATAMFEQMAAALKEAAGALGSMPLMRMHLSVEELAEFYRALLGGNLVGMLDGLVDRQYVLDGDFLAFGMDLLKEAAFQEVHASNMSKLGEDGKPIIHESGRVMKGPSYRPPDLGAVIRGEK